jgi:large subunit ribosomal protein L3
MPKKSRPKRGSMAFSPRKRAKRITGRIRSWPEVDGPARIQGFAGYKAGMTHAIAIDPRPKSTTSGQEIQIPVTVIETPPMNIVGIRFYKRDSYGLKCVTEVWSKKINKEVDRVLTTNKKKKRKKIEDVDTKEVEEVRLLMHTNPKMVLGLPKKKPEILEIRVGGGTIEERINLAKEQLGKEISVADYGEEGKAIDVIAVTKGKGFQGPVKRWGVKLLSHKNSKHRRQAGTMGPWRPRYVMRQVPLAGQVGMHQRTEYNKIIVKVGESGEEVSPNGGFVRYGTVKNNYILILGSVPGPPKRLVRIRDATRFHGRSHWALTEEMKKKKESHISYISTASKQGR